MPKLLNWIGYVWAFPVTFWGLSYASFFNLIGWYVWHGVEGEALVWLVNDKKIPTWLSRLWKNWGGHAIGNVIVLKYDPSVKPLVLKHEQKHVDQVMRLGIFQPIVYAINLVAIRLGCSGSDPYFSNPFEIDARRYAGQVIDVEGYVKKINDTKINKE